MKIIPSPPRFLGTVGCLIVGVAISLTAFSWLSGAGLSVVFAHSVADGVQARMILPLIPNYSGSMAGNLDDDATQWNERPDPASSRVGWAASNQPSSLSDGQLLELEHLGGSVANASPHFYRIVASTQSSSGPYDSSLGAQAFQLDLDVSLLSQTTYANCASPSLIQALEFGVNRRVGTRYLEWVAQWENVGTVPNGCQFTPRWRLWTGLPGSDDIKWYDIGQADELIPNQWYHVHLCGNIDDSGNARYVGFVGGSLSCSSAPNSCLPTQSFPPGQTSGSPAFSEVDVEIQLDGNSQSLPYNIAVDNVQLSWWSTVSGCS